MVIKQSGKVGFWQAIKDFWKGYVSFQGTTTRAGYWWACLGNYLLIIAAVIISFIALFASNDWVKGSLIFILVLLLCGLVLILPSLALLTRRFRDVGLNLTGLLVVMITPFVFNFMASFFHINFLIGMATIIGIFQFILTLLPSNALVGKWLLFCCD